MQRAHDIGIRLFVGSGSNAEKSRFGIDRAQSAVGRDMHPGDIVANCPDAVALLFERGDHHGKIRFSAGAGESRGHVGDFAGGIFQAEDQHVLGHPALVARHPAGNSQGEAFLAEKSVAAVARANAPDQIFLRKMENEPAIRVQIAQRMESRNEVGRASQAVERRLSHPRHDAHAGHHVGLSVISTPILL